MNKSSDGKQICHGPFTWVKRESLPKTKGHELTEEVWDISNRPEGVTYFCVKNYGGKPNDTSAFSGWRLVSGSPFTDAGGWESLDEAIKGATPYLMTYYRMQAESKIAEAKKMIAMMTGWSRAVTGDVVTAGAHLRGGT